MLKLLPREKYEGSQEIFQRLHVYLKKPFCGTCTSPAWPRSPPEENQLAERYNPMCEAFPRVAGSRSPAPDTCRWPAVTTSSMELEEDRPVSTLSVSWLSTSSSTRSTSSSGAGTSSSSWRASPDWSRGGNGCQGGLISSLGLQGPTVHLWWASVSYDEVPDAPLLQVILQILQLHLDLMLTSETVRTQTVSGSTWWTAPMATGQHPSSSSLYFEKWIEIS